MCELKVETIVPQGTAITLQMYPKSEVDKVIAEKDAEIAKLNQDGREVQMKKLTHETFDLLTELENFINTNNIKKEDIQSICTCPSPPPIDYDWMLVYWKEIN